MPYKLINSEGRNWVGRTFKTKKHAMNYYKNLSKELGGAKYVGKRIIVKAKSRLMRY